MNSKESSITEDVTGLVQKFALASQTFLTEGVKLAQGMSAADLKSADFLSKPKDTLVEAFNLFARLNIQYASNLIDIGLAVTQNLSKDVVVEPVKPAAPKADAVNSKPAFVLKAEAAPGATVVLPFLLDSIQDTTIHVELKQTAFASQDAPEVKLALETTFTPQSFDLLPTQSQKIEIRVSIPQEAAAGAYESNVVVHGFENTYFTILILVSLSGAS